MMIFSQSALLGDLPWGGAIRRGLSRSFDLCWEYLVVLVLLSLLFSLLNLGVWGQMLALHPLGRTLCLLLALLIDTAVFAAIGNTPGKAFLRLNVRKQDGSALQPRDYLHRNVRLWWGGLGLGLPYISLLTMSWQLGRIALVRPTGYDRKSEHQVVGPAPGWLRCLGFGCTYLAMIMIGGKLALHSLLLW